MIISLQEKFGVRSLRHSNNEMMAAVYLQVSIVSQALIFVTRSRSWSYVERPGTLLMTAFLIAQMVRIEIASTTSSLFIFIYGIGSAVNLPSNFILVKKCF